jgi:protein involved in polysaccharide export with SLBB domain
MKRKTILFLAFLLLTGTLSAQVYDLSKLTPEQVEAYRNMKSTTTAANPLNTKEQEQVSKRKISVETPELREPQAEDSVFGVGLFSRSNPTFEPNLNIPTPKNYVLGAFDELIVDISGMYEANYKLKVSPDGNVRIPNVGPVQVAGQSIESATRLIKGRLSKIYSGVNDGSTRVSLTLGGNIRSIRVMVIGEANRPGTYTLPSLATAFNALYACGGPGVMGSMRDIRVIRDNKVVAKIAVYRFLMEGKLDNNIALQDEDVIRVEPYGIRVQMNGAIKHEGLFEAVEGETLKDLIGYAGGFTDKAYKNTITAFRLTEKGKTVVDVPESFQSSFLLKSGDSFKVTETYDKFDNKVDIEGSIFRPGAYALEPGMTVKQLIAKADGLRENAYRKMAEINRKKENQVPEILGFNLGDLMDDKIADIPLQKDDSVHIFNLFDFRLKESVSISGAVKEPGTFPMVDNITLKDLIFKAKGFADMAATGSVVLVRVIKDPKVLYNTDEKTTVIKFAMDKDLNFLNGDKDVPLMSGDQVIVRYTSGYEGIRMVRIDGEVVQPGSYSITSKSERISDLIKRSGGFTKYAYPMGAYLIRYEKTNDVEKKLLKKMAENVKRQLASETEGNIDANLLKTVNPKSADQVGDIKKVQDNLSGSNVVDSIFNEEGMVGINLKDIMVHAGGKNDLYLEEGDLLYVPRELQTVRVMGEVLFPTFVRYDKYMPFNDYISNAGGYSDRANRKSAFVLYANGTAKSTKSFLGFHKYPQVFPGARIVIPEKPTEIKSKMTTGETISMFTSIATVAALIYSILR